MKRVLYLLLIAVFVVGSVLPLYGTSQRTITLSIGSAKCIVDGQELWMDVAPFVQDGRTFVPIRFVSEALGANVNYTQYADGRTKDVIITFEEGTASVPQTGGVVILSKSDYTGEYEDYHIVGEVQNQTSTEVDYVEIIATFYNASNVVVGTENTYANPYTLAPGQKAPFDIIAYSSPPGMASYSLTVTWQ